MEVRFYNHRDHVPGSDAEPLEVWADDGDAIPSRDDFVNLSSGPAAKTWLVHYRVWRLSEARVDVYCSPWEFNF